MAWTELIDEVKKKAQDGGVTVPGTPAPAPAAAPTDNRSGIANAYKKYLGRDAGESDYQAWIGNNNYEAGISGSPEAAAYAKGQTYQRQYDPALGFDQGKLNDPTLGVTPKYDFGRAAQEFTGWSRGNLQPLVDYYNTKYGKKARVVDGDKIDFDVPGWAPIDILEGGTDRLQWLITGPPSGSASGGSPAGMPGGSGGATSQGLASGGGGGITGTAGGMSGGTTTGAPNVSGNSVFSDPATTEWEQLLRSMVDKLNQPQQTWSPQQLDLQQTQALDPLERQRTAAKQQLATQLSSRGVTPQSGIFTQAMMDLDRQFNQMDTTTRANFATQAIGREDQVFQNNETRARSGVDLMKQIPQLADTRLATAQGSLQNPIQLLQFLQQQQNQNTQNQQYQNSQNQQFWTQLANIISQVF